MAAQTYAHLEVVVIDDGSSDNTADIADAFARTDARFRVVRQSNGGVAAARNSGIALTSGEYVAPVDADDLWHPTKIERQLDIFAKRDASVGLVYTWYAMIDHRSHTLQLPDRPTFEGNVLTPLAYRNFIGNGSSALIRRSALERTGGFDSSLRARGGQGCEDWKLYMEIAEHHAFGVVPAYLTGYRYLPNNMSSDVLQMLRSRDLCIQDLLPRHPGLAAAFRSGRNRLSGILLHRAIRRGRPGEISKLLSAIAKYDPMFLASVLAALPVRSFKGATGRVFGGWNHMGRSMTQFADLDPTPVLEGPPS